MTRRCRAAAPCFEDERSSLAPRIAGRRPPVAPSGVVLFLLDEPRGRSPRAVRARPSLRGQDSSTLRGPSGIDASTPRGVAVPALVDISGIDCSVGCAKGAENSATSRGANERSMGLRSGRMGRLQGGRPTFGEKVLAPMTNGGVENRQSEAPNRSRPVPRARPDVALGLHAFDLACCSCPVEIRRRRLHSNSMTVETRKASVSPPPKTSTLPPRRSVTVDAAAARSRTGPARQTTVARSKMSVAE